jgi:hypothetical protein
MDFILMKISILGALIFCRQYGFLIQMNDIQFTT